MAKLGQALLLLRALLVVGFVIAAGATRTKHQQLRSSSNIKRNISINSNNKHIEHSIPRKQQPSPDLELEEYFYNSNEESSHTAADEEEYEEALSPRSRPVFYIKNTIWSNIISEPTRKNNKKDEPKGFLPKLVRHLGRTLFDMWDDGNILTDDPTIDDSAYKFPTESNQFYNNYHEEDLRAHDEELMDDDDSVKPGWMIPEPEDDPTPETEAPTMSNSAMWEDLDEYDPPSPTNQDNNKDVSDTEILMGRPRNVVALRMVLGVVNVNEMSKDEYMDMLGMALRTTTIVLNNSPNVPFIIMDSLEASRDSSDGGEDRRELELDRKNHTTDSFNREEDFLAKLFLENVVIEEGDFGWGQLSAFYSVWKNPLLQQETGNKNDDGGISNNDDANNNGGDDAYISPPTNDGNTTDNDPRRRRLQNKAAAVKSRNILMRIENICNKALEESIDAGIFWETLKTIDYGDQELVMESQNMYYSNDKGMIDVQDVGDEYDLTTMECHMDRPENNPYANRECPLVEDDDYIFKDLEDDRKPKFNGTYTDVLADSLSDIEWETREWVGLGMMGFTLLLATLLPTIAHFVFVKRQRKAVWGTRLTSGGVDDILKVGWRVTTDPALQDFQQSQELTLDDLQQEQQQQLFLQIYDKGGEGYNDENSLLRGGVEQQFLAPPSTAALFEKPPVVSSTNPSTTDPATTDPFFTPR